MESKNHGKTLPFWWFWGEAWGYSGAIFRDFTLFFRYRTLFYAIFRYFTVCFRYFILHYFTLIFDSMISYLTLECFMIRDSFRMYIRWVFLEGFYTDFHIIVSGTNGGFGMYLGGPGGKFGGKALEDSILHERA